MEKQKKIRIVTAASLFDGHDAAINIMRRIMQAQGAEVIHLGHNRSAQEIVEAAVQEDADAIAIAHTRVTTRLTTCKGPIDIQVIQTPATRATRRCLQRPIPLQSRRLLAIKGRPVCP